MWLLTVIVLTVNANGSANSIGTSQYHSQQTCNTAATALAKEQGSYGPGGGLIQIIAKCTQQ